MDSLDGWENRKDPYFSQREGGCLIITFSSLQLTELKTAHSFAADTALCAPKIGQLLSKAADAS